MGLNHQMAALSCAIAEAYFLNRTLLFPAQLCLNSQHEKRWRAIGSNVSHSCVVKGVRGFIMPTSKLIDVSTLSRLVPLKLVPLELMTLQPVASRHEAGVADVDRSWRSERIARELPCAVAPRVRRRVSGFWFRPCSYGITNCDALATTLDKAVGARGTLRHQKASGFIPHLLRSGVFYSAPIREAATAVRRAIGGPYAAVHVRRSDRVSTQCLSECKAMEALTRPRALLASLTAWYRRGTRLYIGSTEPPAFFDILREHFNLTFAEEFAGSAYAAIESNYALYAAETLVFFGAASMVETFGYTPHECAHARLP